MRAIVEARLDALTAGVANMRIVSTCCGMQAQAAGKILARRRREGLNSEPRQNSLADQTNECGHVTRERDSVHISAASTANQVWGIISSPFLIVSVLMLNQSVS